MDEYLFKKKMNNSQQISKDKYNNSGLYLLNGKTIKLSNQKIYNSIKNSFRNNSCFHGRNSTKIKFPNLFKISLNSTKYSIFKTDIIPNLKKEDKANIIKIQKMRRNKSYQNGLEEKKKINLYQIFKRSNFYSKIILENKNKRRFEYYTNNQKNKISKNIGIVPSLFNKTNIRLYDVNKK